MKRRRLRLKRNVGGARGEYVTRFDAFDTSNFETSNEKTRDGGGELTDLTDLTPREMGVYVPPARAHLRPHPLARSGSTPLPFSCRQIRQTRQIARRQRGKMGVLRPPGVKSVKSTPRSDIEVNE